MSKIVVDQIQKSGGAALTLPSSDGVAGASLVTDGSGALSFAAPAAPPVPLVAPEGYNNFGSIVSHTDRQNIYSTGEWTSSGPWTSFTNYSSHQDNHAIQFMNMALGDGMGANGTSQQQWIGDTEGALSRQLLFANGNRLGYSRDQFHYDNSQSNAGHSWQIMPLRNPTDTDITVTLKAYASNYWQSGSEGCALFTFTPTAGLYSGVISVVGASLAQSTSNATMINMTGSATIPAYTTILACIASTDWYTTTYRFKDTNFFYDLTALEAAGVICDMSMLSSLRSTRFNMGYTGTINTNFPVLWTKTATIYGDR